MTWSKLKDRLISLAWFTPLALLAVFFSDAFVPSIAHGQTTVTIPLASGSGIKTSGITRAGINLADNTDFGDGQMLANLLADDNPSFSPQVWQETSYCRAAGSSTTAWQDNTNIAGQPANFWKGATYQIASGTDVGNTGTITASSTSSGYTTLTLSGTLGSTCANGDVMFIRQTSPSSGWAGTTTPTQIYGQSIVLSGGATVNFQSADLAPSSTATQNLETVTGTSGSTRDTFYFDSSYSGGGSPINYWLPLNGTYTLTFRAKAKSGTSPSVAYVVAHNGVDYLNSSVTPTVNSSAGAGWNNYSFSFTASETSATAGGYVVLTVSGGDILISDVALTESPVVGNTTPFRNAVYEEMLRYNPGIIRSVGLSQWACPILDMVGPFEGRRTCGYSWYFGTTSAQFGSGGPYGIGVPELLQLAYAVDSSAWFTYSFAATPAEAAGLVEYLAGRCGNGNAYTTLRCNEGQTTPWTTLFAAKGLKIYVEHGNEVWNQGVDGPASVFSYQAYGQQDGALNAAMKTAPDWTNTIVRVEDGWSAPGQMGAGGWIPEVLSYATAIKNGSPDMVDGAAYLNGVLTQFSSNSAVFGPWFAEPYNLDSTSIGGLNVSSYQAAANYLASTYPGIGLSVYEESGDNLEFGLSTLTQAQVSEYGAGEGAALAQALHYLLLMRDAGVLPINMYSFAENWNRFTACTSTTGGCSVSPSIGAPIWGSNFYSYLNGSTNNSIDRPEGIAFGVVNQAIGSNNKLLSAKLSNQPTYSQAAAQPDPEYGGTNAVYANSSVPYVDCFAFSNGSTSYTLICDNTSLTSSEVVDFAGPGAPTGTVTKTVFTSMNPTDNNDSVSFGGSPTVGWPKSTTLTNPTSDTLPEYSIVAYTYTVGSSSPQSNTQAGLFVVQ